MAYSQSQAVVAGSLSTVVYRGYSTATEHSKDGIFIEPALSMLGTARQCLFVFVDTGPIILLILVSCVV